MFFFTSRRRHTRWPRDWSSDVCSSDLTAQVDSQYEIPYETSFDGHRIKDARYHEDQRLTLAGVLSNSSNVGTVQISEEMEPQIRHDYLTDRKSTRLNSSHVAISYAVFCLKK